MGRWKEELISVHRGLQYSIIWCHSHRIDSLLNRNN